jgi:putative oxidoreductase
MAITTTSNATIPETHVGVQSEYVTRLIATSRSLAPIMLRLGMATVFLAHGLQKTMGLFGGAGYSATMTMFTHQMGIPAVFAFLAIMTELLAPLALIAGLFTRLAALALTIEMIVAVLLVHLPNGFFMNWAGTKAGEGFEFHILAVAMGVALMIAGGGQCSIDRLMYSRMQEKRK